MHWNWIIIIYLFLRGLGSGAYLTSFAAEKGWLGTNSRLAKLGYYIAPLAVAVAALPLVFHLGQGLSKPWLMVGVLSNVDSSVMTWGVYILAAFVIVGGVQGFYVFKNKPAPKVITWAGVILALANVIYTGLLLAVSKAISFWDTGFLPLLLIVSALLMGFSAVALLAYFVEKNKTEGRREGLVRLWLIAAELVIVAVYLGSMLAGVKGPAGTEAAALLVSGPYKTAFWGYFLLLGLLFPLTVFIRQYLGARPLKRAAAGPSGGEVAAAGQQGQGGYLPTVANVMVIIGDLTLRALILFAAIPVWNGFTLP